MTRCCPHCRQPLPPKEREGIYLPARKVEIFDFIDKHPGIAGEGIAYHCGIPINAVRQHVYQINAMLAETYVRISGDGTGTRGEYRVIRNRSKRAKAEAAE